MQLQKKISWIEPLELAAGVEEDEGNWIFLYSGMRNNFTGQFSILALKAKDEIKSGSFIELTDRLNNGGESKFDNSWFGYLGYGLKNSLEKLPQDKTYEINLPDLWMVNYSLIILFDHDNKRIEIWADSADDLESVPLAMKSGQADNIKAVNLTSNMTKAEYLAKVVIIKDAINKGDLYQANLTRKFSGNIKADPFAIFSKLCAIHPSPYSAFLKMGDKYILSSSPERFLYIDEDGYADTRPIKGSAPRFSDKKKDEESRNALENSEKDKAENLMIVDLSRNDLSRSCEAGSVKVDGLFEVTSYATIHHMASKIYGKKREDVSSLELVKGCFPPGSMTGAPKIKAMELCSSLEQVKRGVYSGAIGWFGGDGSADLSVVIRTLIIDGDKFEFQVGGAIVADSVAEKEWEETLTKAKAVAQAIGINVEELAAI